MEIHVVKVGDTVSSIAQLYGVSYKRLIFDNQIVNPNKLIVGQSLIILLPEIVHTVSQGESLYTIAKNYNV